MKIPTYARLWLVAAVVAFPALLSAQDRTVTGVVTASETGQPLIGVRVGVKGTSISVHTGDRGNYAIRVPETATTLVFSYLGYRTAESTVGTALTMDMQMDREAIGLEGIVVTALGVQRERATLGYALQDVLGEELARVPEMNLVNSLQGLMPGLHITDAGPQGGSARIVIRGAGSIAGGNQPTASRSTTPRPGT